MKMNKKRLELCYIRWLAKKMGNDSYYFEHLYEEESAPSGSYWTSLNPFIFKSMSQ